MQLSHHIFVPTISLMQVQTQTHTLGQGRIAGSKQTMKQLQRLRDRVTRSTPINHQPSQKTPSCIIFFKIYWTGRQFHKDESAGNDDILVQSCVFWDRLFLKKSSCCCEAEPFNVCHSLDSPNSDSCPKHFSGRLWSIYVSPVDNHGVTWLLLKPQTPATVTVTAAQCGGLTVILRRSYCS